MPAISIATRIGRLTIEEIADAIVSVRWAHDPYGEPTPVLVEAAHQVEAYFAERLRAFDLPLAPKGSTFEKQVWAAMCAIPYGQTRTYGEIAEETSSGPRAVGRASGRNPIPVIIPCHRILARGGLGGYSGGAGLPTKHELLALEGALPGAAELPFGQPVRPSHQREPRLPA